MILLPQLHHGKSAFNLSGWGQDKLLEDVRWAYGMVLANGSAQPATNLKKIPFKCPPFKNQAMWQKQVHPLLSRFLNNHIENETLAILRDTLLPKLMSGELDVSNLEL